MLMRWCIRQGTLKDKVGLLVHEIERVMVEWPDTHNNLSARVIRWMMKRRDLATAYVFIHTCA